MGRIMCTRSDGDGRCPDGVRLLATAVALRRRCRSLDRLLPSQPYDLSAPCEPHGCHTAQRRGRRPGCRCAPRPSRLHFSMCQFLGRPAAGPPRAVCNAAPTRLAGKEQLVGATAAGRLVRSFHQRDSFDYQWHRSREVPHFGTERLKSSISELRHFAIGHGLVHCSCICHAFHRPAGKVRQG